jgi:sec-independent protein translocase protein TatA
MTSAAPGLDPATAAFGGIGPPEVIIIVLVILLLFGGRKLPEVARGTGRALRIFKAETKGLMNDEDDDTKAAGTQQTQAQPPQQLPPSTSTPQATDPSAPSQSSSEQTPPTHTEK